MGRMHEVEIKVLLTEKDNSTFLGLSETERLAFDIEVQDFIDTYLVGDKSPEATREKVGRLEERVKALEAGVRSQKIHHSKLEDAVNALKERVEAVEEVGTENTKTVCKLLNSYSDFDIGELTGYDTEIVEKWRLEEVRPPAEAIGYYLDRFTIVGDRWVEKI